MNEKKSTYLSVITGMLVILVNLAINFVLSPYIVNTLGEEANGFTQLANNFVYCASFITIAFNSMAARFISISYHQGDKDKMQKFYSSTLMCNLAIIVVLLPIALYIVMQLENLINVGTTDVLDLKLLFLCVFLNFFVDLLLSAFQIAMFVKNALYLQNAVSLIRNVLYGILLFVVFSIFPAKVFYVSLLTLMLGLLILPAFIYAQSKLVPELKFDIKLFSFEHVKEMFKAGIWNAVNQGGNILMTGLDLLIANLFVGSKMMGVLSVSKTIPTAIVSIVSTINTNFSPSVTKLWATESTETLLKQLRTNIKFSSIIVLLPIVTFTALGEEFYSLWMPTLDAKILTQLSFLAVVAYIPAAGTQTLFTIFTAMNKMKVNSVAFIINGVVNVILVIVLVNYTNLGVYAIAGVSSITSIVRNIVVTLPYVSKLLKVKWYEFYKDTLSALLYAAINFGVGVLVKNIIIVDSWGMLIVAVLIIVTITLCIEFMLCLSKEEKEQFINIVRRKNNG